MGEAGCFNPGGGVGSGSLSFGGGGGSGFLSFGGSIPTNFAGRFSEAQKVKAFKHLIGFFGLFLLQLSSFLPQQSRHSSISSHLLPFAFAYSAGDFSFTSAQQLPAQLWPICFADFA
jgi:hypothetical protein